MQFSGRQTEFSIDLAYGIAFTLGFGYMMVFGMDARVAAFQGGLVLGYFLRVWEKMTVYERVLQEEVADAAESQVEEEVEMQVPDAAEEQVADEVAEQVPGEVAFRVEEQVQETVAEDVEEEVAARVQEEVAGEVPEETVRALVERIDELDADLAADLEETFEIRAGGDGE